MYSSATNYIRFHFPFNHSNYLLKAHKIDSNSQFFFLLRAWCSRKSDEISDFSQVNDVWTFVICWNHQFISTWKFNLIWFAIAMKPFLYRRIVCLMDVLFFGLSWGLNDTISFYPFVCSFLNVVEDSNCLRSIKEHSRQIKRNDKKKRNYDLNGFDGGLTFKFCRCLSVMVNCRKLFVARRASSNTEHNIQCKR